ncbi:MAG: SAP domain-containing protein [Hymenobacteraceae bacterium]|nr:SAP domain-containing protein [Hymenobacteraceae bacterium]MDX5482886.1 SAP domain-containing protein [Hymenobacteraceae bacterium]
MKQPTQRPALNRSISPADFDRFYWLKQELQQFCREQGLPATGAKAELAERIVYFLKTGKARPVEASKRAAPKQRLSPTLDTLITENYRNTEVNRRFFKSVIGEHFHFTTNFMRFCRENVGKTFSDAVQEWHREHTLKKDKGYQAEIGPQFEYNRYIRDFMADNPGSPLTTAIRCWKGKKSQPGSNAYSRSDLQLLRED